MTSYKPGDRQTVVPRLFTKDIEGLVAFIKAAFGAKGRLLLDRPTELVIGDCVIMVADGNAARNDQDLNATLHTVYRSFGDVRPTDEVLAMIHGVSPGRRDGAVRSPP